MDPNIWGPGAWLFLHSITLNYPRDPTPTDREVITNFFMTLGKVLPCFHCRDNYARHLKKFPIRTESKTELTNWLIDIHNDVRQETGKPTLTYDEAVKKIICTYRKCWQNPYAVHIVYLGIVAILLSLCYCLWRRR